MEYVQFANSKTYQVKNTPPMWQVGLASGKEVIKIPSGAVISSDGSIDMKGGTPGVTNGIFSCNLQGNDAKCTHEQESNPLFNLAGSSKLVPGRSFPRA